MCYDSNYVKPGHSKKKIPGGKHQSNSGDKCMVSKILILYILGWQALQGQVFVFLLMVHKELDK